MLVNCQNASFDLFATLVEPEINKEASTYIKDNYNDLITYIRAMEIKEEKSCDLLHDVFVSIVESENDGIGFDMDFGNTDESEDLSVMDVAQFVKGRIKLYAKNSKYRTDVIESVPVSVQKIEYTYEPEVDAKGRVVLGKNGQAKMIKTRIAEKVPVYMTSVAASFTDGGDKLEDNDDFQRAYASAATPDSTDDVLLKDHLREQIDYCIDICELHGVKVINVLKNLDLLADMLGDVSKKKKTADNIFAPLTNLVEYHDELCNSLIDVIRLSASHKNIFNEVISAY